MKIESLKQLEAVIKLCRKQGVTDIKVDGIELHLGAIPQAIKRINNTNTSFPDIPVITPYTPGGVTEQTDIVTESVSIATDALNDDELMFYSARQEIGTEQGPN